MITKISGLEKDHQKHHLIKENMVLNSQTGCQVAILDLIGKSMAPDKGMLKSVLIMYFEPQALHE
jgi:hypothetical protein